MRLSHDRWYSRDGQRKLQRRAFEKSSATRKVLSLVVLLALVIVSMQQLSDPARYEPAFAAIGLTTTQNPQSPKSTDKGVGSSNDAVNTSLVALKPELAELLREQVTLQSESQAVDRFMQAWQLLFDDFPDDALIDIASMQWRESKSDKAVSPEPPSTGLRELLDAAMLRVVDWKTASEADDSDYDLADQMEAWLSLMQRGVTPASASLDEAAVRGLDLALDRSLVRRFVDVQSWHPRERTGLARTIERGNRIRGLLDQQGYLENRKNFSLRIGPRVEVRELTKLTNEYRGQVVRLRGQPASSPLASQVTAPGWDKQSYSVVWMKPDESNPQPVGLYILPGVSPAGGWPNVSDVSTTELNAKAASSALSIDDVPMMEVTGILLKRLAYPSQRGIDTAPILVVLDAMWSKEIAQRPQPVFAISRSTQLPRWREPGNDQVEWGLVEDILAGELSVLTSDNWIASIEDASAWDTAVKQAIKRSLYQIPRLGGPLSKLMGSSKQIGGASLGRFEGWVVKVDPIAKELEFTEFEANRSAFRLTLQPNNKSLSQSDSSPPEYAIVNEVPQMWRVESDLRQPISLDGLYIKHEGKSIWLSDEPHWGWPWPDDRSRSLSIDNYKDDLKSSSQAMTGARPTLPADWLALGAAGYNLAALDRLRDRNKQTLAPEESESLFSLIRIAARWDDRQASEQSFVKPKITVLDLLKEPNSHLLKRLSARVRIVRVSKITLSSDEGRRELDGDHYYELDGLADLNGQSIRLVSPDGKSAIDFQGEYPITILAKHLPDAVLTSAPRKASGVAAEGTLFTDDISTTDDVWYPNVWLQTEGYFYRLWAFSTAQTRNVMKQAPVGSRPYLQNGPLIVATDWASVSLVASTEESRSFAWELLSGLAIAGVCVYFFVRFQSRSGGKSRRRPTP